MARESWCLYGIKVRERYLVRSCDHGRPWRVVVPRPEGQTGHRILVYFDIGVKAGLVQATPIYQILDLGVFRGHCVWQWPRFNGVEEEEIDAFGYGRHVIWASRKRSGNGFSILTKQLTHKTNSNNTEGLFTNSLNLALFITFHCVQNFGLHNCTCFRNAHADPPLVDRN